MKVIRLGEKSGFHVLDCAFAPSWRQLLGVVRPAQWRFRVVAKDGDGRERTGVAWCGGWFLGLLFRRVELTWN
jgi:hypothetical protein